MVLDAVLADRTFTWLGTESEKRSYFIRRLQGRVELQEFPRLTFGAGAVSRGSSRTLRPIRRSAWRYIGDSGCVIRYLQLSL